MSQRKLAEKISDQAIVTLVQKDTFFNSADGRLKLREFPDARANLIFYQRINTSEPTLSDYHITETDDPISLKSVLQKAYGVRHIVKKVRSLYMVGRTRLHFDVVEGLGEFIELEVVLDEHDSIESGEAEAERLMHQLNIQATDLIDLAYVDLLEQQTA